MPEVDEQHYLQEAKDRINNLLSQEGNLRIHKLKVDFQDSMTEHCGVFRTEEVMKEGLDNIQQLKAQYPQIKLDDQSLAWNTELIEALELQNIMIVGEMILTSAYHRQESRGAHSREDFPSRNDPDFLRHTLASYQDNQVNIDYMPVVIDMFEEPYRIVSSNEDGIAVTMYWWNAWRLYERLFIAMLVTFLIEPLLRMCVVAPVMVMLLMLHYHAKPYKESMTLLSWLDISSYACLSFYVVDNMFRSFAYIFDLPLGNPIDKALNVLSIFEAILTPLTVICIFIVTFILEALYDLTRNASKKSQ